MAKGQDKVRAMIRKMALFRKTAEEIGERLGYPFPDEFEKRVMAYLRRVKNLERGAVKL